ncbi:hypothetical protein I7I53_11879 [Histoplasma capsulatum var. duboisii H88]|uniref:Uncharacterized protein n=1 Tax=Ajellomyces capsulatus (strain H88) TaxID=544711 RepID=A0A8A1LZN8_AJEC8|nr:hypothetical protein I7I53_11879 [Histoplasma capsulatum var. duboisii H88]
MFGMDFQVPIPSPCPGPTPTAGNNVSVPWEGKTKTLRDKICCRVYVILGPEGRSCLLQKQGTA